jgi:hypothetical protein
MSFSRFWTSRAVIAATLLLASFGGGWKWKLG